jgi:hypothetical protein
MLFFTFPFTLWLTWNLQSSTTTSGVLGLQVLLPRLANSHFIYRSIFIFLLMKMTTLLAAQKKKK